MKRVISLALSAVILITCFAFGTADAFAYQMNSEPKVELGQTFTVNVPNTNINDSGFDEKKADAFFAKFTPEKTDYYEFVFSKKFIGKADDMLVSGIYSYDEEDYVNYALVAELANDKQGLAELLEISDNPSVAAKLTAGKTYSLVIFANVAGGYKDSVTIRKHTHTLKTATQKSFVDGDSFKNNTNGKKYVKCTCNNCDYTKTQEVYYKVKSVKLKKTKFAYNGKEKKPAVTVKDVKDKTLKRGTDYVVLYSRNKDIGTGTATIKFKGKYNGSVVRKFRVNPKETSLVSVSAGRKSFYARWKRQMTETTGYQLQYSTGKKFKKNKKTVTVAKNTATSKTVSKLKAKKTYYVRVRTYKTVGKAKYYSAWSKPIKVKTK